MRNFNSIVSQSTEHVGSVEEGKLADLVLWHPAFFGVKPEMVIKGGQIVLANMGKNLMAANNGKEAQLKAHMFLKIREIPSRFYFF